MQIWLKFIFFSLFMFLSFSFFFLSSFFRFLFFFTLLSFFCFLYFFLSFLFYLLFFLIHFFFLFLFLLLIIFIRFLLLSFCFLLDPDRIKVWQVSYYVSLVVISYVKDDLLEELETSMMYLGPIGHANFLLAWNSLSCGDD